jgi:DNA-binding beta-propeller fold protein YncE
MRRAFGSAMIVAPSHRHARSEEDISAMKLLKNTSVRAAVRQLLLVKARAVTGREVDGPRVKRWRSGSSRRLVAAGAAALLLAGLVVAGAAVGATGDLGYDGCVSNDGSGGSCADVPGTPLSGAGAIALSPDSKSLYVASLRSGTITHFFAAANGQISYDGCVSNDGSGGLCADAPGSPLTAAEAVAVSPGGGSVYVASEGLAGAGSATVTHFFAAPGGQLNYDGCISNDISGGCAAAPGSSLIGANAVAVSPAGSSVYVTAPGYITHFFAAPGGQLTYDGCISNDGSGGLCADAPGSPLSGAQAVAVSPDGRSVYVVSGTSGTLTHFFAAAGGQLSYDGCVSSNGSGGACAAASADALTSPTSVAVSPDGKSVYVTAAQPGAVSHFFAAAGGQLTYDGCISNDGSGGACANAPGSPLGNATSVAVSPDGSSVYVASPAASGTLSTFAVASGGQLTYSGCISSDGSDGGCTDAPGKSLQGVTRVAVSPNGNSVYAGSFSGGTIMHFFRSSAGSTGGSGSGGSGSGGSGGGGSGGGGGTTGTTPAVLSSLAIKPSAFTAAAGGPTVVVKPSSRVGATVTYRLSAAASVSFVVAHAVAGRRQKVNGRTRCVAPTRRNAHAGTCVRVLTVGSFTQAGAAGANSFRFSGRINGARLPAGSGYALTATPAGGTPVKATFRIKHA